MSKLAVDNNKGILILISVLVTLIVVTWSVGTNRLESQTATSVSGIPKPLFVTENNQFELPVEAALAVSSDLKTVYYARNLYQRRPIASLTKLMSAIVVLDNYKLTDPITISPNVVSLPDTKSIFRVRETLKVFDVLAALLIESNNEAAYALAEHWPSGIGTAQSKIDQFIEAMNQKTQKLEMKDTHFSDPAGLDDNNNLSSAWDVALLIREALKYPILKQLTTTEKFITYSQEGWYHEFINSNKLLSIMPEIQLGKTGFTDGAGQSLAMVVENSQKSLIVVLLAAQDRFADVQVLLEQLHY